MDDTQQKLNTKIYFSDNLEQIQEALNFVLQNDHSSFYKEKYKKNEIKLENYKDFASLPVLKKSELLETEIENRTFIPSEEVNYYSLSSGTTSQNKPLILNHKLIKFENIENKLRVLDTDLMNSFDIKNFLLLFPINSGPTTIAYNQKWEGITPILGDLKNLPLMAIVAKEVKLDAIIGPPTILLVFAEELKKIGFNLEGIKYLLPVGEFCSEQKRDLLKMTYPNAYLDFKYGASECGNGMIAYGNRCKNIYNFSPSSFHPAGIYFLEIVDENYQPVEFGQPGKILITDLYYDRAFPFIRYEIGDYGTITETDCNCGNKLLLTVGGREKFDILKFHGVQLISEEIEKSLRDVYKYLDGNYQMHVYEEEVKGLIKPRLEIHLVLKKGMETRQGLVEIIRKEISDKLWLSQTRTLTDLEKMGVFLPLEIKILHSWSQDSFKSKNIISHLQ